MKSGMLRKWRVLLAFTACVMLVASSLAGQVSAQDAQPTTDPFDPTQPQGTGSPEATQEATEEATEEVEPAQQATPGADEEDESPRSGAQRVDPATSPGSPATLAHGLAYYDGDDLVWQVQEIEVPLIEDADSEVSPPAIVVQREGQSIIRNNATGKRALLSPGEAFFITADDSYTIMAEDDGSTMWKFSLVDPDDVAGDAFYESPPLTAVRDNTYDFQLVRYVLQPGDEAELPSSNGAGMVMPGTGEVQVDHDGDLGILGMDGNNGQGQMLKDATSISNTGSEPTVVFYAFLGDEVSDDSSAPAEGSANATSDGASATPGTNDSSSGDSGSTDTGGNEDTSEQQQQPEGGPYLAQINIYAVSDIYLTVVVDGQVWFDGTLPAGQWTGPMNGSSFEVTTSSGVNTMFENACGDQFFMGEEPADAVYVLNADANSCPPPA